MRSRKIIFLSLGSTFLMSLAAVSTANVAQAGAPGAGNSGYTQYGQPPVMDNTVFGHVLLSQLEGRTNGPDNGFRWNGEGWVGTDMNKLWIKSEGFLENGEVTNGDTEALYARPIPYLRYFDFQAGARYNLDSNPGLWWGAVGIEGLAPYFFEFEPTFYFSDRGRVAGRIEGSYDILITQRLIAQPQIEMNFYNKSDPSRGFGSGLSEIDSGFRVRYEITRKFAPYLGFAYTGSFGRTATFVRNEGGTAQDPRFVFGVRLWY